jgi:Gnt-I system low-affinity gluconate transporter
LFGAYISAKISLGAPDYNKTDLGISDFPPLGIVLTIIVLPIVLILANTLLSSPLINPEFVNELLREILKMIGHPFTALIIANMMAWYWLGLKQGFSREKLLEISTKSFAPAGIIILLTGAGGVLKQMLIDTGSGEMMASYFAESGISLVVFAFITAAIVRILQGSSTVSMITAAGLCAPLLTTDITEIHKAILVIAIAAGSSILSHVNDSGFWLVSKYLGLTEKQTFLSWTVMTSLLALTGFLVLLILSIVL